jgi:general nucleoside transport system permease protein
MLRKLVTTRFTAWRTLASIVAALAVSAGVILLYGVDPVTAYQAMVDGAVGDQFSLATTGVRTTPILLTGIAVALSFRAGAFNIGGEGQLYVGAAAATFVGIHGAALPGPLLSALCLAAAFVGGALWILVPALLKVFRNVSEIVTTLMFNFIGILLVGYLIDPARGPMAARDAAFAQSPPIAPAAQLPTILPGTGLHAGLLVAVAVAVLAQLVVSYTPFGFRLRMLGSGLTAARFAGIATRRTTLQLMLLSGGIAGMAGGVEVLGLLHGLYLNFSPGYGYDGITVALLAANSPLGSVFSALFIGGLRAGANNMQQVTGLESSLVVVIQALVILFLIWDPLRRRLQRKVRRPLPERKEGVGA